MENLILPQILNPRFFKSRCHLRLVENRVMLEGPWYMLWTQVYL